MVRLLTGRTTAAAVDNVSLEEQVSRIRETADGLHGRCDAELVEQSTALSVAVQDFGVDDPRIHVPAGALITESIRRTTGLRLHDAQLLGGLVIARGQIAEMQTGEGKTLVAAVGAFIRGLSHRGVHVSTTNAYLARRDFEGVAPLLDRLGLSVGLLEDGAGVAAVRRAYQCDVTYGTGYQFGFDYLRDQIALREQSQARLGDSVARAIHGLNRSNHLPRQRGFAMAIVDEADSVMIDEAMVPLIISGQSDGQESDRPYMLAQRVVTQLVEGEDYEIDPRTSQVSLTAGARSKIHDCLRGQNMRSLVRPWTRYIENALHANHRLRHDQHYVVRDAEVQIVDQNTGRIFSDRTWRDGLHQAVEAKEGIEVRPSEQSTSRITRQRFFKFYDCVSGLTGTAADGAPELRHFYGLDVVQIPTNVPCQRKQLPSRFFATAEAKLDAICKSAQQLSARRQPVLIGTATIEQSLDISKRLGALQVAHVVLNGMQDADEADIVSQAGQAAAITVATNMAGRGTDIKPCDDALKLGGLHVIVTEHALSRRIDRQLVGRAARQGNPGSCQYFVSAEDELIAKYGPKLAKQITTAADQTGECQRGFSSEIEQLQSHIEQQQFEMRKKVVQSDAWFDTVREALH